MTIAVEMNFQRHEFTAISTNRGYTIYYRGKSICGASTLGHSFKEERRSCQAQQADRKMFAESASREIDKILIGLVSPATADEIRKIANVESALA